MLTAPIKKLLIANRGEIAVRIARTCREMGIVPVAVYSEADRRALHVRMAGEAWSIGGAAAQESYLSIERLIDAAKRSGADAVHPGYGFLSENGDFADACVEAGLVFIGPSGAAMRAMGDKSAARSLVASKGVQVVPGSESPLESREEAAAVAGAIGYPLLLKAAAGGGGRGIRAVERPEDLAPMWDAARREAEHAFGDGRVFLEKLIRNPRHVEFQVLADAYGNVVHLFDRDCTVQRRHQKLVEEAPSPAIRPETRIRMGAAAVAAARACGYVNAGTVEFLVDDREAFYFIEMNTRLQVEHPVTEWVTGLDLVAEQLRIAGGEALGYEQAELALLGHAMECRVYAEDPRQAFAPSTGRISRHAPPGGFGVRVDAGIERGDEVGLHYDPLLAKVSTWGRTRAEAIRRMERALGEYDVGGVDTTIPFCRFVMRDDVFKSARFSTDYVQARLSTFLEETGPDLELAAAAAALVRSRPLSRTTSPNGQSPDASPWHLRRRVR
jgi:acetyl-CoA carboxylase, biotin carboxylase subunit